MILLSGMGGGRMEGHGDLMTSLTLSQIQYATFVLPMKLWTWRVHPPFQARFS